MPLPPWVAGITVFTSGSAILIIEIAGLKLLAPAFGSSFHVWTGQIGVVMLALALGYMLGGQLIDKFPHLRTVAVLLFIGGLTTIAIPSYTRPVADAIANRHYAAIDEEHYDPMSPAIVEIAPIWEKLDPMLGSFAAFFLPCLMLAGVSPSLIRLRSHGIADAGSRAGDVFAWGTIGSLLGLFATAYILIDTFPVPVIMQGTGAWLVIVAIALFALGSRTASPVDANA